MSGIGASSEVRSAIGVSAAPVQSHSQHSLHQQQQQLQHQQSHQSLSQQQNQQQQPQPFLPQLSSNNLKSVTLEAYNSPQFKAMLEQLSKPISVPPEQINYPPEWPSQDKISECRKFFTTFLQGLDYRSLKLTNNKLAIRDI